MSETATRPHEVLYRRFRPGTWGEVQGQDRTVEALRSQVVSGKLSHTYLFVGDRGCGKTTSARLLAAAVNCENISPTGDPCGTCVFCSGVRESGNGVAVLELDAASNRGIDAVKGIISQSQVAGSGRYKVFVIDEVHALTPDASTALLKTLEDAPPNTIFILCTTEYEKIKATIRSRATVYRFRTLEPGEISPYVRKIAAEADIAISDDEIDAVVSEGAGSVRDTLSALERFASGGGITTGNSAADLAEAVASSNPGGVVVAIARAISDGAQPQLLGADLLRHLRYCLLSLQAPELLDLPSSARARIEENAKRLRTPKILRLLSSLADALGKMTVSGDPRILLEATLVAAVTPEAATGIDGLHDRFDELERRISKTLAELSARVGSMPSGPMLLAAPVPTAGEWPPDPEPEVEEDRLTPIEKDAPGPTEDPELVVEEKSAPKAKASTGPRENAEKILDAIVAASSNRLRVKLHGATAKWETVDGEERFAIDLETTLSDRAYDDLAKIIEANVSDASYYVYEK